MPKTKNFNKLLENIEGSFLGETVPERFQKEFGKIYNKKDILPLAIKIARSRGIKIDK